MDTRIAKAIELLQEDSMSTSIKVLAGVLNMSSSRFSHLFKSETGMSVLKYIQDLRLERAAYLLTTSFLSVKEIQRKTGSADYSHFLRDFKKRFGTSPTEYRALSMSASTLGPQQNPLANSENGYMESIDLNRKHRIS